jgi:hypothetical protein
MEGADILGRVVSLSRNISWLCCFSNSVLFPFAVISFMYFPTLFAIWCHWLRIIVVFCRKTAPRYITIILWGILCFLANSRQHGTILRSLAACHQLTWHPSSTSYERVQNEWLKSFLCAVPEYCDRTRQSFRQPRSRPSVWQLCRLSCRMSTARTRWCGSVYYERGTVRHLHRVTVLRQSGHLFLCCWSGN